MIFRLGDLKVNVTDFDVNLSKDYSSSENINNPGNMGKITWELNPEQSKKLIGGLTYNCKKNFERCSQCEYFVMSVNADNGESDFSCGKGASKYDMLNKDICIIIQ